MHKIKRKVLACLLAVMVVLPLMWTGISVVAAEEVTLSGVSASTLTYGQALSSSTITGTATASGGEVAGRFEWVNPRIVPLPNASSNTYEAKFIPTDTTAFDEKQVDVSVSVSPMAITITPDSGQRKVVGTTDPVLTYRIISYGRDVTADVKSMLTGALSRSAGETAGSYSILQGSLDAATAQQGNLDISFTTGAIFTITSGTVPSYTTASQINSAVSALPSNASAAEIDLLANAMRALGSSEKKRLSESTIIKLGELYRGAHGFAETVRVYNSEFSNSSKMPDDSEAYGAALAAGNSVAIELDQQRATNNADLQFIASMNGSVQSPIIMRVALPDNFITSRKYYVSSSNGRLTCELERNRGEDRFYAVFTTTTMGTFRLMRSSGSNNNDYETSAFWENVIDKIASADRNERVRVNVGTRTTMSADVLRELKGTTVTLVLRRSNGDTISIYGKDVKSISSGKEYYTMSALDDLYGRDTIQLPSPSSTVSSKPIVVPAPPPPPVTPPPPAPKPPVWIPPVSSAIPSSSVASSQPESSQIESSQADEREDIVVEAEEDELPQSKPQEPTGGEEIDSVSFGLFVLSVILFAAVFSGLMTFVMWNQRRNRYL